MVCAMNHMACAVSHMVCAVNHMACAVSHMVCAVNHMACAMNHMVRLKNPTSSPTIPLRPQSPLHSKIYFVVPNVLVLFVYSDLQTQWSFSVFRPSPVLHSMGPRKRPTIDRKTLKSFSKGVTNRGTEASAW